MTTASILILWFALWFIIALVITMAFALASSGLFTFPVVPMPGEAKSGEAQEGKTKSAAGFRIHDERRTPAAAGNNFASGVPTTNKPKGVNSSSARLFLINRPIGFDKGGSEPRETSRSDRPVRRESLIRGSNPVNTTPMGDTRTGCASHIFSHVWFWLTRTNRCAWCGRIRHRAIWRVAETSGICASCFGKVVRAA